MKHVKIKKQNIGFHYNETKNELPKIIEKT
jgi:hypothetical protein